MCEVTFVSSKLISWFVFSDRKPGMHHPIYRSALVISILFIVILVLKAFCHGSDLRLPVWNTNCTAAYSTAQSFR